MRERLDEEEWVEGRELGQSTEQQHVNQTANRSSHHNIASRYNNGICSYVVSFVKAGWLYSNTT